MNYDEADMVVTTADNTPVSVAAGGESNPMICRNYTDGDGNPAGGYAHGRGVTVVWQDGPRGKKPDGTLSANNGAFVEDALVAAWQRLNFFQQSKFAHDDNAEAMQYIQRALGALQRRAKERASHGVQRQNAV